MTFERGTLQEGYLYHQPPENEAEIQAEGAAAAEAQALEEDPESLYSLVLKVKMPEEGPGVTHRLHWSTLYVDPTYAIRVGDRLVDRNPSIVGYEIILQERYFVR